MNFASDYSLLELILSSSLFAQIILAILLVASFTSLYLIVIKWLSLQSIQRTSNRFMTEFASAHDLKQLYHATKENQRYKQPSALLFQIFEAGLFTYLKNNKTEKSTLTTALIDDVHRAMVLAFEKKRATLARALATLATIGSVTPYIGLLGTVLGIMNAFLRLSTAQNTTLVSVAPGIAEALIATAFGLFAAIPALIGYNYFVQRIDQIEREMVAFINEFDQILRKNVVR